MDLLLPQVQRKETGPAGSWAATPVPQGPQHPVMWNDQRRGAGQGLSCPLHVGTAPQGADSALMCPPWSTFASHWSSDMAKRACLLPSTLLSLSSLLSSSTQRPAQDCGPSPCSSQQGERLSPINSQQLPGTSLAASGAGCQQQGTEGSWQQGRRKGPFVQLGLAPICRGTAGEAWGWMLELPPPCVDLGEFDTVQD